MPTSSRRSFRESGKPTTRRPFAREPSPLKAEEVYDSLVTATNVFTDIPIRGTDVKVKLAAEADPPDEFVRNINDPILKEITSSWNRSGRRTGNPPSGAMKGQSPRRCTHEQPPRSPPIRAVEGSYLAGWLKQTFPRGKNPPPLRALPGSTADDVRTGQRQGRREERSGRVGGSAVVLVNKVSSSTTSKSQCHVQSPRQPPHAP